MLNPLMRCPVCRAEVEQGPTCRRCRADLSLLFQLEAQRQRTLSRAAALIHQGGSQAALALAEEAQRLRDGPEARRLDALASLFSRDFARAWRLYRSIAEQKVD
jgi:methylphosphotriester-DNA--protein-cysteine methyltransferase